MPVAMVVATWWIDAVALKEEYTTTVQSTVW